MAPDIVLQSGYKLLYFTVAKQAMVLSYIESFLNLGVMFLLCLPFVLMTQSGTSKVGMSAVH